MNESKLERKFSKFLISNFWSKIQDEIGVLAKFFWGGTGSCQKIYGGPLFRVLLHFYNQICRTPLPLCGLLLLMQKNVLPSLAERQVILSEDPSS